MLRCLFACLSVWFVLSSCLLGQTDTVPLIENVGVDEHLGERIDLSLTFTDSSGTKKTLGEIVQGDKPTILAPVYYSCPRMCTLTLNGVKDLVDGLALTLGQDYRVVAVSFDPENTPELAQAKADNYRNALQKPEAAKEHWHFLTGDQANISALMDRIGFRYKKVNGQYSHVSVLVLLSPDGAITRYIYGLEYPPREVRLSLVEAADGKVGSTIDKILIYCFKYDALAGKYVPYAWGIMRIGALLTLAAVVTAGFFLWRKELLEIWRLRHNV